MEQGIGSDQFVRENFIPSLVSKKRPKFEIDRVLISLLALGLGLLAPIALLRFIALASVSEVFDPIPARIVVNTLEDEEIINGSCSLREAITAANINYSVDKCPAGSLVTDTITFDVAGTISLTAQLPYILDAGPLTIDGGSVITVSGDLITRALWVNPDARLTLQNLTVYKSGELDNFGGTKGGALYNDDGIVNIQDCVFSGNTSSMESGGAIYNLGAITITRSYFDHNSGAGGGGITNMGKLMISDSTFFDNIEFTNGFGGAISNDGTLEVTGSNFEENSAASGGGIANFGKMLITNSTFSNNRDWGSMGICDSFYNWDGGSAIWNGNEGIGEVSHSTFILQAEDVTICNLGGELTIQNSIVSSDPAYTHCLGTITDGGYNIDSQDTCGFDPANGSLINTDPLLGPLQYNGGPTWTHAPESGSPAIDAANPQTCPTSDQRGVPRPFDGDGDGDERCDIGAYEFVPPGVPRSTETSIFFIQPVPSLVNKPIIVSFKVTSGFGIPTGTVTVTVADHAVNCTGTLTDGLGSCSFMLTEPGTYTLTATYGGEGDYLPSADIQAHQILTTIAFLPLVFKEHPLAVQILWVGVGTGDRGITYYMYGMLMNISSIPVYSITLTAYIFDEKGNSSGIYTGTTPLPATFPGQRMPFIIGPVSWYKPPNSYVVIPHYSYHSPREYRPVTVVSQEVSNPSSDWVTVSGEIRNDQDVELRSIKVIVMPGTGYSLYAVASLGADTLLPGETTPYTYTGWCSCWPDDCHCPTDFSVQGQGYLAP